MNPPETWWELILQLSEVGCVRGGRQVLRNVTLTAKPGELVAIRGANGAGKSTLLRVIAGLLPKSNGVIELTGKRDEDAPTGSLCHYVGHLDALKPALSVRETLSLWQALCGTDGDEFEDALSAFDIDHLIDLPAGYLSAGQRRRLGLARLLVAMRPIWLLDEPTSALDRASETRLGKVMEDHLNRGGMILAATHLELPVPKARQRIFEVSLNRARDDEEEASLDRHWSDFASMEDEQT